MSLNNQVLWQRPKIADIATHRLLAAEVLALMKLINGRPSAKSLRHVMDSYSSDDLRKLRDQLSTQSKFCAGLLAETSQ